MFFADTLLRSGIIKRLRRVPTFCSLDHDDLCRSAQRRTGLVDFGSPPLFPALQVLTESLEQEGNLHPLGRFLARMHLRTVLETRLRLVAAWKAAGDRQPQQIRRPIFITGMPRSGSTFLHELLAQDAQNRAPRFWEVMFPLDVRPNGRAPLSRTLQAEMNLWCFRRLAPSADSVYPLRPRSPHECVAIHSYTFLSQEFVSTFRVPSYEGWLRQTSMLPAYQWEKRFLQHLEPDAKETRWMLKAPDHVRALDTIFQLFPDAVVFQMHRNPLDALASLIQLSDVLQRMFAWPRPRAELCQYEAGVLAESMELITRFRDAHPELAGRFVDIQHRQLIADPIGTVRRIYSRLGLSLKASAARNMERLVARRQRYGNGEYRATLADLGLDSVEEASRFSSYSSRFGIA